MFFQPAAQAHHHIIISSSIISIIIMKSSFDIDNNYFHYVTCIQRIAGFTITLYYHPA
jgi:hypothetical protein